MEKKMKTNVLIFLFLLMFKCDGMERDKIHVDLSARTFSSQLQFSIFDFKSESSMAMNLLVNRDNKSAIIARPEGRVVKVSLDDSREVESLIAMHKLISHVPMIATTAYSHSNSALNEKWTVVAAGNYK